MPAKHPYAVHGLRPFTADEARLLSFVVSHEHPDRMHEIDGLMVVGRCGCEKCPTILLGRGPQALPEGPSYDLTHIVYVGANLQGVAVAVALLERLGRFSELEAWSFSGEEVRSWPRPEDLQPTGDVVH